MALMPFVMFGLSAMVVSAARDERHSQLHPPTSLSDLGKGFTCPDECLECCQAHATGVFEFGWLGMHTDDRYKCVLKNSSKLPPGCIDTEAQTHERKHMGRSQYKVTCPFGDGLKGDEAAARRNQLPSQCSKRMGCCCHKNQEPWERCFDISVNAASFQQVSSKTGTKEFFVREKVQTKINNGTCVKPSSRPKHYNFRIKDKLTKVSKLGIHGRCCLNTSLTRKDVRTGTDYKTKRTQSGTYEIRIPVWDKVSWIACKIFERVYVCTEDNGLTQSGTLYKGLPFGQCLGLTPYSGPILKVNDHGGVGCPVTHRATDCVCEEEC